MFNSRSKLIADIQADYEFIIHDDFDPDNDLTADQHLEWLHTLSDEELATI